LAGLPVRGAGEGPWQRDPLDVGVDEDAASFRPNPNVYLRLAQLSPDDALRLIERKTGHGPLERWILFQARRELRGGGHIATVADTGLEIGEVDR
jgi:hypothetical protein